MSSRIVGRALAGRGRGNDGANESKGLMGIRTSLMLTLNHVVTRFSTKTATKDTLPQVVK
jgi:hypothetical protein